MRRVSDLTTLVLGLCVASLSMGCAGVSGSSSSSRVSIEDADSGDVVALPFTLTPRYGARLHIYSAVAETLIQQCMSSRGFSYGQVIDAGLVSDAASIPATATYPSEGEAAAEGYAAFWPDPYVEEPATLAAIDLNQNQAESVEGWALAVNECAAAATTEIDQATGTEAVELYQTLSGSMASLIVTSADLSENGRPVYSEWSLCMGERGYDATWTGDLVQRFGSREWTDPPSPLESQTAVDDLQCRRQVGLRESIIRGIGENVEEWVRANEATIIELRQHVAAYEQSLKELASRMNVDAG